MARTWFAAALALTSASGSDHFASDARFRLAGVLWKEREKERAVGLALQARGAYAATGGYPQELGEIDAWLAQHRAR